MAKTMTCASTQGDHLWPCGHVFIKPLLLCGMQGEMDEIYGGADISGTPQSLEFQKQLWIHLLAWMWGPGGRHLQEMVGVDEEPVEAMT